MGSFASKVEGVIRPAQSGKTRTYQNMIKEYENLASLQFDCEGFINVVICSNNKTLVDQTAVRHAEVFDNSSIESEEGDADDKVVGRVYSWMSGTSKNNISVRDLAWRIVNGEVTMVVCCGHSKRLSYLKGLIKELDGSSIFKKKVNIWIDEADESIKKWSNKTEAIAANVVHSVTLISATFDAIVKHKLFPNGVRQRLYPETHPECYIGTKDCEVIKNDSAANNAREYLELIYTKYADQLFKPGMRLFAPGDVTQESHDQITDFLVSRGWAVLILNGSRKEIVKPDGTTPLQIADYASWENGSSKEISEIVASMYYDSGLDQYPFAITGQMCIGRGLTFQSRRFLFDWGIIPNMRARASAYQCGARMFGNIRDFPNYKQCVIVTTSRMVRLIEEAEQIAISLAKGQEGEVGRIDKNALKKANDDMKMSIPVIIDITSEELEVIHKSVRAVKEQKVLEKLDEVLQNKLRSYKCDQISLANADKYYKKVVTDIVIAAQNGRRPGVFKEGLKTQNVWQAILDKRENRIILTYYNGA